MSNIYQVKYIISSRNGRNKEQNMLFFPELEQANQFIEALYKKPEFSIKPDLFETSGALSDKERELIKKGKPFTVTTVKTWDSKNPWTGKYDGKQIDLVFTRNWKSYDRWKFEVEHELEIWLYPVPIGIEKEW